MWEFFVLDLDPLSVTYMSWSSSLKTCVFLVFSGVCLLFVCLLRRSLIPTDLELMAIFLLQLLDAGITGLHHIWLFFSRRFRF